MIAADLGDGDMQCRYLVVSFPNDTFKIDTAATNKNINRLESTD